MVGSEEDCMLLLGHKVGYGQKELSECPTPAASHRVGGLAGKVDTIVTSVQLLILIFAVHWG